jgi:hypothetical protein
LTKKTGWDSFWAIFHKLIWSPCQIKLWEILRSPATSGWPDWLNFRFFRPFSDSLISAII